MIGSEVIFDKCLIILGEDIQAYSKKLLILGSLEENVPVFKIFDYRTIDFLTVLGVEVTGSTKRKMAKMKKCKQCKKEFQPKDELDIFCSQDCKEEALADLDKDSDECLSCQ